MKQVLLLCSLLSVFCLLRVHAHGTHYEMVDKGVVGVRAMFDTGQPMAGSKALVFAPGETKPCLETVTDKHGIVCFKPDRPGTWVIQVREKSGHGMRINLTVGESLAVSDEPTETGAGTTYVQKIIMAVCVVWGFIGAALYFRRRGR